MKVMICMVSEGSWGVLGGPLEDRMGHEEPGEGSGGPREVPRGLLEGPLESLIFSFSEVNLSTV